MKITVYGSSSDGNAYCIEDGCTKILLECGLPMKKLSECSNYQINTFNAVVVTHCHADHIFSLKELYRRGIQCYCGQESANRADIDGIGVNIIKDSKQFEIGTFKIVPFKVKHVNVDGFDCENFGYLFYSINTKERMLYVTDAMYIKNQFKDLNYIMIEVNYQSDEENEHGVEFVEKRRFASHMELETAIDFLEHNDLKNVKKVVAIHLSEDRTNSEVILKALRRVTGKSCIIAKPGVVIE
ncbi:MAG: MBL fold metallo-hydrolase [Aminipila sp.]